MSNVLVKEVEQIAKAWSAEARKKAAEARRGKKEARGEERREYYDRRIGKGYARLAGVGGKVKLNPDLFEAGGKIGRVESFSPSHEFATVSVGRKSYSVHVADTDPATERRKSERRKGN